MVGHKRPSVVSGAPWWHPRKDAGPVGSHEKVV